jgi:hypothetical protein
MEWHVFVSSIAKQDNGQIVITASNGKMEGPPFVRFTLSTEESKKCFIGKRYVVSIKETDNA